MEREYIKAALLQCLDLSLPEKDLDLVENRLLDLRISLKNNRNVFSQFCSYLQSKGVDYVKNYEDFERFWEVLDDFRKLENGFETSGQLSRPWSTNSSILSKYGIPDTGEITEYGVEQSLLDDIVIRPPSRSDIIDVGTSEVSDSDKSDDCCHYEDIRKISDCSIGLNEGALYSSIASPRTASDDRFEVPGKTEHTFSVSLGLRPASNDMSEVLVTQRFSSDDGFRQSINHRSSDHIPKTSHSGNFAKELRRLFKTRGRSSGSRESVPNSSASVSEDVGLSNEETRRRVNSALSEHERASMIDEAPHIGRLCESGNKIL